MSRRFFVDKEQNIIDKGNPANATKASCFEEGHVDEGYLRECVLLVRLAEFVKILLAPCTNGSFGPINSDGTMRLKGLRLVNDLCAAPLPQLREEAHALSLALMDTIRASHLNTFHLVLSVCNRDCSNARRQRTGMHHSTSLSLFAEDVEGLLRDLYEGLEDPAFDKIMKAIFNATEDFVQFGRKDLWKEHQDAWAVDYACGIGVPDGYGISGSDHRRAQRAAHDLAVRARAVRASPSSFNDYTTRFINILKQDWPRLGEPGRQISVGKVSEERIPF